MLNIVRVPQLDRVGLTMAIAGCASAAIMKPIAGIAQGSFDDLGARP